MNRKLFKLVVFITLTLVCTEVIASTFGASYIAKWKGDAQAAYSITFDDNGLTHKDIMKASILEEYGLRGTFFPITSYMNVEMFSEIFHRGHELGSHSVTHPKLSGTSIDLIWSELNESKLFIEELIGAPCITYAAPYGNLTPDIIEVAQELYISARGIQPGINAVADENIFNLKRGPCPSYSCDPNTCWTDDEYSQRLKTYVEEVIEAGGWGIDMFHNLALSPQE